MGQRQERKPEYERSPLETLNPKGEGAVCPSWYGVVIIFSRIRTCYGPRRTSTGYLLKDGCRHYLIAMQWG